MLPFNCNKLALIIVVGGVLPMGSPSSFVVVQEERRKKVIKINPLFHP